MSNLVIHSIYFDDCDGEMDLQAMVNFSLDDISYDMVSLDDSFMIDSANNLDNLNRYDLETINLAIQEHIKNKKLNDNDEKINKFIFEILKKTNKQIRSINKNQSYIISIFNEDKKTWSVLQILSSRLEAEYFLSNLLDSSKKNTKRLNANISRYLHDMFREKCMEKNVDMQDILEELINNYVS